MHKVFYASGFLYRPQSQQILLQQFTPDSPTSSSVWSALVGVNKNGEEASIAFQTVVRDMLKIKLVTELIYPVYDYFHTENKKLYYVFYAEVGESQDVHPPKGNVFSWFTFKQTLKLPFTQQAKQDIIVVQRVIQAKFRELSEVNN